MLKIFSGVDTHKERKKFLIFHACTLILCQAIVALVLFIISYDKPVGFNKINWIVISIFSWNVLGSWRLQEEAFNEGWWIGRIVGIALCLGFPFVYLYNLWRVLFKNEDRAKRHW